MPDAAADSSHCERAAEIIENNPWAVEQSGSCSCAAEGTNTKDLLYGLRETFQALRTASAGMKRAGSTRDTRGLELAKRRAVTKRNFRDASSRSLPHFLAHVIR